MIFIQIPPALRLRSLFSYPLHVETSEKNPLFEVISLLGPTGLLLYHIQIGLYCEMKSIIEKDAASSMDSSSTLFYSANPSISRPCESLSLLEE